VKVKMIKTGKIEEYKNEYATRLIEQGKAVPAEENPAPAEAAQDTDKTAKTNRKK